MALWAPDTNQLVFEHHFGTDQAASLLNHVTGTTVASLTGTWSGGTGYMDINGNLGPRLDFGYAVQQRLATITAVVDPNTAVTFVGSSGTNAALPATARIWIDANPSPGATRIINGQTITFVASGATGFQVNIGATPQETGYNLAALINAQTATFGCTAFCPAGNSVLELTANVAGTAGNSIALGGGGSPVKFTVANGFTAATALSQGTAGETVTTGLFHSGTNFQGRNAALGTGGLATIANPGGANYYYMSAILRERDFAELRLYGGGALLSRSVGTTAGRTRDTTAHLWAALVGGGTGTAKLASAQLFDGRMLTDAEDLANYLALKTAIQAVGPTVN